MAEYLKNEYVDADGNLERKILIKQEKEVQYGIKRKIY